MAPGLPDRVDSARLAEEAAVLDRVYELSELPRLKDLLADMRGRVRASFAFAKLGAERAGVTVTVQAEPQLVCQRCLQGFALPVSGSSEVEFVSEGSVTPESGRELYATHAGFVSLRELAEEELLLGLPIVAACSTPQTCSQAPPAALDGEDEQTEDRTRPFAALQDLLKKT
jgi:uncharacterized protein